MHNDLMFLIIVILFLSTINRSFSQQTTIYVKRGETAEVCDDRPTSIYAYEYRSFDGKKTSIIEPLRHVRYSNPHQTSLLRITNVTESDSGLYKCPQDDTEWQKLQVYVPVQYVRLNNLHSSSRIHGNELCGIDNRDCLVLIEGEPLDVLCTADGYPRPALDISIDRNGTAPTIMALATTASSPTDGDIQLRSTSISEAYRIIGLTPGDNGRNVTCHVDMKHIDKNLSLSSTKPLYIEFAPKVIEKSKKIYAGINQTRTVNCTVLRANPPYLRYAINGLSPNVQRRTHDDQHDLQYTFDLTPTSVEQFRSFNVTANNSIGFDTCTYELIHGGIPDAITQCHVDTYTSNVTITISCTKSYAQGDTDGYACTLFKHNEKNNQKIFEEIARTKSCIFALENFHEPVEFRVAAFNRYGSLPVNTYGYIIRLNQPALPREAPFLNRRMVIILGGIVGGIILLFFLCCLCGLCSRDTTKSPTRNGYDEKDKFARSTNESEALKQSTDDTIAHVVINGNERRTHQSGIVYDTPSRSDNGRYPVQTTSTPMTSAYHQQKPINYVDRDSITSSLNSIPTRTRTVNNKFYGHPVVDNRYASLSPSGMVVPTSTIKRNTREHDEEEGNESPVYSTTTEVMSETGSFLVPSSSSKRYEAPLPKPRYSTLGSIRSSMENYEKTPLAKPRSRSNSRTRLNNPNTDNGSLVYDGRPVSSSDSGIEPSDLVLQKQSIIPSAQQHQTRYQTLTSPIPRGTEC